MQKRIHNLPERQLRFCATGAAARKKRESAAQNAPESLHGLPTLRTYSLLISPGNAIIMSCTNDRRENVEI